MDAASTLRLVSTSCVNWTRSALRSSSACASAFRASSASRRSLLSAALASAASRLAARESSSAACADDRAIVSPRLTSAACAAAACAAADPATSGGRVGWGSGRDRSACARASDRTRHRDWFSLCQRRAEAAEAGGGGSGACGATCRISTLSVPEESAAAPEEAAAAVGSVGPHIWSSWRRSATKELALSMLGPSAGLVGSQTPSSSQQWPSTVGSPRSCSHRAEGAEAVAAAETDDRVPWQGAGMGLPRHRA
mmetsp:Transcript_24158/g.75524  ORF Transcript_24158/g.75524 Transcript_24158/m.75524 type:complete len:253 (-) Transcript_24158:868-1626(-)